jgi:6-phosphofructokinase 1
MRIALSTGGGDAPGLNAVIRAAVLTAHSAGWDVLGIKRGYAGLLGEDEVVPLTPESVRGIAHLGGTILARPTGEPVQLPGAAARRQLRLRRPLRRAVANARALGIDAIVSIGGDGSLKIAQQLVGRGMNVVCVPKTIDNDVPARSTRSASTPR